MDSLGLFMAPLLVAAAFNVEIGPVEQVGTGYKFTEGPVWSAEDGWLFSDIPADTIYHGTGDVFRKPSGQSNGLARDNQGRLLAAEHKNRRVTRTEKDRSITVIADSHAGKKLNSPNDIAVRSDGTIFFTDPPYGLPGWVDGPNGELKFSGVYAVKPAGETKLLTKEWETPNGIGLSPDEKTLYVADTRGGHIHAYPVNKDGTVGAGAKFCDLPGPDGMAIDTAGRVWCTASDGVRIHSPEGALLHTIEVPEPPANCAFGKDGDTVVLYMTARTSVYKATVDFGEPSEAVAKP